MSPLERLRSGLGLTRGDLTVALFLSATAIAGLFYTQFFEEPDEFQRRVGMARMLAVADSISQRTSLLGLASLVDSASSEWDPLRKEEVIDEGTDGEGRVELSLEDVAPIDLNSAPVEILQLLPGVGEKTAEKIVLERPFGWVDELTRVHGIGPKKLDKMRPYIVAGGRRLESRPDSLPQSRGTGGSGTSSKLPSQPVEVLPEKPGRADSINHPPARVDSSSKRETETSRE